MTCRAHLQIAVFLTITVTIGRSAAGFTIGFEDLNLPTESFDDGAAGSGGFTSGGAFFHNTFETFDGGFTAWSGWAISSMTDTATPGFGNQFSAFTGQGAGGSDTYAVGFNAGPELDVSWIELPTGTTPRSISVTNTTYAALSMRDGDAFAKQFGGADGTDPDFFSLTIHGLREDDSPVGALEVSLADYRFTDDSMDFILDEWISVDLSSLDGAAKLSFTIDSSDVGPFGINTPAYFAIDNLEVVAVPEPSTWCLLATLAVPYVGWYRRRRRGG